MSKIKYGFRIVYLILFLANVGIGILNFGLVFFVKDKFNTSASLIGLMTGLWAKSSFAGCVSLRKLSRKLNSHYSVLAASILMGLFSSAITSRVLYDHFSMQAVFSVCAILPAVLFASQIFPGITDENKLDQKRTAGA
jgi:hypothetical protein